MIRICIFGGGCGVGGGADAGVCGGGDGPLRTAKVHVFNSQKSF